MAPLAFVQNVAIRFLTNGWWQSQPLRYAGPVPSTQPLIANMRHGQASLPLQSTLSAKMAFEATRHRIVGVV